MKLKDILKYLKYKIEYKVNLISLQKNNEISFIFGYIISIIILLFLDLIIALILSGIFIIFMIIISNLLKIRYDYIWVEIDPDVDSVFEESFEPGIRIGNQTFTLVGYSEDDIKKLISSRGQCQICGSILHNRFPDNFPNEYKICCLCLDVANCIYSKVDKTKTKMELNALIGFITGRDMGLMHYYNIFKKGFDDLFVVKKGES